MKYAEGSEIRISAKALGELALSNFCPRCFWMKLMLQFRLPFAIFPGIFSSIDAYTKRVVHDWFDRHGGSPPWLEGLGPIVGYRDPPHHSKFHIVDERFGICLTGTPDAVFVDADGSYVIGDYKTSRFTRTQDELFPMYEVQLNVYGIIGERRGLSPVKRLGLIYMEPQTDLDSLTEDPHRDVGFIMPFSAHVQAVAVNPGLVDPLLARAREIHDAAEPPPGAPACKDCKLLGQLLRAVSVEWGHPVRLL
jgi:hypothetical protein